MEEKYREMRETCNEQVLNFSTQSVLWFNGLMQRCKAACWCFNSCVYSLTIQKDKQTNTHTHTHCLSIQNGLANIRSHQIEFQFSQTGLGQGSQALFLYVIKLLSHRKTGLCEKRGRVGRESNYSSSVLAHIYTPSAPFVRLPVKFQKILLFFPLCWQYYLIIINADLLSFPQVEIKVCFLKLGLFFLFFLKECS